MSCVPSEKREEALARGRMAATRHACEDGCPATVDMPVIMSIIGPREKPATTVNLTSECRV